MYLRVFWSLKLALTAASQVPWPPGARAVGHALGPPLEDPAAKAIFEREKEIDAAKKAAARLEVEVESARLECTTRGPPLEDPAARRNFVPGVRNL